MTEIKDPRHDLASVADPARARQNADEQLMDVLKAIQKDRAQTSELARLDVRELSPDAKGLLQRAVGEQLRGQLPPQLAQSLADGSLKDDVMAKLMQRIANASEADPQKRFGQASSPELARQLATDESVPQHALRWSQFVQQVTHVPQGLVRDRAGHASPKGEGTTLLEMLGQKLSSLGPGLRTPRLVDRALEELSPGQRETLMRASFGDELTQALHDLGITDPLQFVRAGALPQDREGLSKALNLSRSHLLGLLMRAELLRIGPGRNGELGIRPELLDGLRGSGIAMLGTLAAVRSLSGEELAHIYHKLRIATGGFARAVKNGRPVVKRDLIHWARTAARRPSDILLTDREHLDGALSRADAQELVQAWYLENLFWNEVAQGKRREEERLRREEREQQRRRERGRDGREESEAGDEDASLITMPELEYDAERTDQLMCFWISDFNAAGATPGVLRKMYVCIDPETGAIIPQQVDAEFVATP